MTDVTAARDVLDDVASMMAASFARMAQRVEFEGFDGVWEAARKGAMGGKMLRPRLLLAARRAYGPDDDECAVQAAAALELLHSAFLLHDDVIDRDLLRRGEPNLIARRRDAARSVGVDEVDALRYGGSCAILAGDLLISAAHRLLAEIDAPVERRRALLRVFDGAIGAAAAGEHADLLLSLLRQADEGVILQTMVHKTARYSFTAPLQMGALLGGASPGELGALRFIGDAIGVAFQIRDDVLGVFGDPRETGKSVLSDLREGKITLLIASARADSSWNTVAHLFGDPALDEIGATQLRAVIERSGARDHAEAVLARLVDEARTSMDLAPLPPALIDDLELVIAGATERVR